MADTLCLAAKAWSDACYLDEIQSPFKERLTMQDRHDVNKKAIEYAKQVGFPGCLYVRKEPMSVPSVRAGLQGKLGAASPAYTCLRCELSSEHVALAIAGHCAGAQQSTAACCRLHQHGPPGRLLRQQDQGTRPFQYPCHSALLASHCDAGGLPMCLRPVIQRLEAACWRAGEAGQGGASVRGGGHAEGAPG